MASILWDKKYSGKLAKIKNITLMLEKKKNAKHIFGEQNQEADHWANLAAEGQRKILVD